MNETKLTKTIVLDDSHPQGVSVKVSGNVINKFVVNDSFVFQRFFVYDNGTVVCDEVSRGRRIIRINREFTRVDDDVIITEDAPFT